MSVVFVKLLCFVTYRSHQNPYCHHLIRNLVSLILVVVADVVLFSVVLAGVAVFIPFGGAENKNIL
jgi:hypothetical protein